MPAESGHKRATTAESALLVNQTARGRNKPAYLRRTMMDDVHSRGGSVGSGVSSKDPNSIKDKVIQRLMMKMAKQFGDDPSTMQIISSVITSSVKEGQVLKPTDLDQMEKTIFQRLSNVAENIALDQFQPRLVANAHKTKKYVDKYGGLV